MIDTKTKTRRRRRDLHDEPTRWHREVERAVLSLILVSGRWTLFEQLEVADFHDPLHRFLFEEVRRMSEAGYPACDVHALVRWLQQPATLRRGEGVLKREDVYAVLADVGSEFALIANEPFYVQTLVKERLRRGLIMFAAAIPEQDAENPEDPMKTLKWLSEQLDRLWARAAEVFPDEMLK